MGWLGSGAEGQCERVLLLYSPVWMLVVAAVVFFGFYEQFSANAYMCLGLSVALPCFALPALFPAGEDKKTSYTATHGILGQASPLLSDTIPTRLQAEHVGCGCQLRWQPLCHPLLLQHSRRALHGARGTLVCQWRPHLHVPHDAAGLCRARSLLLTA